MNEKLIFFIICLAKIYFCQETTTTEDGSCENTTCLSSTEITKTTDTLTNVTLSNETTTSSIVEVTTATTTGVPIENNITENATAPKYDDSNVDEGVCLCNLERNICDINCCCDPDCTKEQKEIFSSCDSGLSNSYDAKFCHSIDFIYVNNTPTTIDVINNELFCVISSNLPPSYVTQASQPIETIEESVKLIFNNFKWGNYHVEEEEKIFNLTQILKHGDNLWIRKEKNGKIEPFYLPTSFLTNVCMRKSENLFLENYKSSCSHMINEEIDDLLFPETYFDFSFINFNSSMNLSYNMDLSKDCPNNICIPLNISICDESFLNCDYVQQNDTRLTHGCQFSLYNNEQTCTQIVQKVKYQIYHNGTQGITSVNLFLNLKNITFYIANNENELQFEQNFEINFIWVDNMDQERNYSNLYSGNPGYLIGKPVLVANINDSTINETDGVTKFDFIQNGSSKLVNIFSLPQNHNGYCKLTEDAFKEVSFGYNLRTTCKESLKFPNSSFDKQFCLDVQEKIFELFQISIKNQTSGRFFGSFGNSNRLNPQEWIELKYIFNLNETLEKINYIYQNGSEIVCQNLVNIFRFNILYSKVDLDQIKNQNKILSAFVDLSSTKKNLIFAFEDPQNFSFDLKVISEVMFFDVTAPKIKKYYDPPSLDVKLPRDFFYPFMRSNGTKFFKIGFIIFINVFVILSLSL